jgi:hypothetical protein
VIGTDCIGSNAREIEHAFSFMNNTVNVLHDKYQANSLEKVMVNNSTINNKKNNSFPINSVISQGELQPFFLY